LAEAQKRGRAGVNILLTHHIQDYVSLLLPLADSVHVVDDNSRRGVPQQAKVFALRLPEGGFRRQVGFLRSYLERERIGLIYAQGVRELLLYSAASRWSRRPPGGGAGPTMPADSQEDHVDRASTPGERSVFKRPANPGLRPRARILVTSHSSYTWRSEWKPPLVLSMARVLGDGFMFLARGLHRRWSPLCRQIGLPCWHVPNPVDVSRFSPKTECERSAELQATAARATGSAALQGSPPARVWRLGYVGVVNPMKGQHVLLQAVAQLHQEGFQLRVELVGDTLDADYKHKLDDIVACAGLQSVVTFHGRVSYTEIPGFLAGLDVYVCPSLSEMMPFHVLEAMAAGLPVVGTKIWGVEDAVIPGQNGFLCAPASAEDLAEKLRELLQSPNPGAFGQASRRRAERCYDIPVVAEQYRQVLRDLRGRYERSLSYKRAK
jgi:glycosyltransferase involved in cell wall biosynthesis